MPKETTKDYIYLAIIALCAGLASLGIWKTADGIVAGTSVAIASGGIESKVAKTISVATPIPLSTISNPVHVTGKAKNNWFFEATFPVEVIDEDGVVLGQGQAHAATDWTVPGMIDFSADITWQDTTDNRGFIVLTKDDPSGLGNVPMIKVPIFFRDSSSVDVNN